MILVKPEQCVPGQEALHLAPAVIENERVPIRLLSLPRVGVLVKMRAVKIAQARLVFRKVRRNPIQNDSDSVLMEVVHQKHEVRGRSEAAGRCEVANRLVTPRTIERVLGDREEFDMRKTRVVHIVGELNGYLPICEPAVGLLGTRFQEPR